MPLRPLAVSILIFIFLMIGFYEIYAKLQKQHSVYRIAPNERWIGVIDMDTDHGVDMNGVVEGQDVLLTIDYTNPLFIQLVQNTLQTNPLLNLNQFEVGDYDANKDGLLNEEDPIYPFLHVIYIDPSQGGYETKSLASAGIRAIKIEHLTPHGNHEVILSDGSTRTLYEISRPGGTSVYKNRTTQQVDELPEVPQ